MKISQKISLKRSLQISRDLDKYQRFAKYGRRVNYENT